MIIHGYAYNLEERKMYGSEVELEELGCENGETIYGLPEHGPLNIFSDPFRLRRTRAMINELVIESWPYITVYLEERDGIKARQLMLNYLKRRLRETMDEADDYLRFICEMQGANCYTDQVMNRTRQDRISNKRDS